MDWLKTVLPTIATALGGPVGGIAATFIAEKLGMEDKTVEAVKAAISGATPEQLARLKEIDADLDKYFAGLGVKLEEIEAADRASARDREAKTGDSLTPRLLALGITVGFFGVLATLLVHGKPEQGGDALLVMLGSLGGAWASCVAYYFGSTKGSAEKTAIIARGGK